MNTLASTRRPRRRLAILGMAVLPLLAGGASAGPACPYPFSLSGNIEQDWKQVTNSAWKAMLGTSGWTDNGFHFYSRVRERGPENGINTPSDLETEIRKKVRDTPVEGSNNRRSLVLPLKNASGQSLRVLYDYDGGKASKCQLVTLTF